MQGFIKLHRKICKWEWYQDANTFRLFIHLLLNANHEEKRWQGMVVGRGQTITGRHVLAKGLNLSEQQIRTSLNKLKSTSEITIKPTNRFSLITLVNYDSYQSRDKIVTSKSTSNPTNKQPTDNHKQECKELKEDKNKTLVEFEVVWKLYGKKGNRKTSLSKFEKLTFEEKRMMIDKIPDYVQSTPDKQFRKNFETYINQECWNDEILPRGINNGNHQKPESNIARVSRQLQEDLQGTGNQSSH